MSELGTRMELIKTELGNKYPLRMVTRAFADFAYRTEAELTAGLYTIVSANEGGYKNYSGREGMDGRQQLRIYFQQELAEDATGDQIEEAEFSAIDEIKAFLRDRPATLAQLFLIGFVQSEQLDAPYAWVRFDLEIFL